MAGYIGGRVAVSVPQQVEAKFTITATASQTSITNVSYTVGSVHVFQNGVRLVDGTDFTATNGSTVTLETGATEGDQIVIVSHGSFETGDVVSKASGGTFSSAIAVDGSVTATSLVIPDGSLPLVDLDIDGGTDIGAALVDADLMIVDDGAGGTNRKATMTRLATYIGTKITGGSKVFIASSGVLSNAASVSFTQFDASKFDHYEFMFQHIKPVTDDVLLFGHASIDSGSNYDVTDGNYHRNTQTDAIGFPMFELAIGNAAGEYGFSGTFHLYGPHLQSFTYGMPRGVYMGTDSNVLAADRQNPTRVAAAHLSANDVDAIQFKFTSGNITSGEIVMYGISNGS